MSTSPVASLRGLVLYASSETLEWVAQTSSGGPIPGNIQCHVGRGSEQLDLVEDIPGHCRGVGLDDL